MNMFKMFFLVAMIGLQLTAITAEAQRGGGGRGGGGGNDRGGGNNGPTRPGQVLSEGYFNYRGDSYYSNGAGSYCRYSTFDSSERDLSRFEEDMLKNMRYDGWCKGSGLEGYFNMDGFTYYANGAGVFCQSRKYKNVREISREERRQVKQMRFDGYCK